MNQEKERTRPENQVGKIERNNYFYGKTLTVRDFQKEQEYFNRKRWLLNRTLVGWGVVGGLEVRPKEPEELKKTGYVTITPGMALDWYGREIILAEERTVDISKELCECPTSQEAGKPVEKTWAICLEYGECQTEQVRVPITGCQQEEIEEYNRIREHPVIQLRTLDELPKPDVFGQFCHLRDIKTEESKQDPCTMQCETPTVHEYLCKKLGEQDPTCSQEQNMACVILCTLTVTYPPCPDATSYGEKADRQKPEQSHSSDTSECHDDEQDDNEPEKPPEPTIQLDCCSHRKLVYSNHLLYDFISCYHGDVPHIVDFNWRDKVNHNGYGDNTQTRQDSKETNGRPSQRQMDWDEFYELCRCGFTVTFDQKMDPRTLNPHTFIISVLTKENRTGYRLTRYLPAQEIRLQKIGECYTATFILDPDFIDDECDSANSDLGGGVVVEILLRGSSILGKDGKALDGDYIRGQLPTGNGVQGGDFVDWFTVLGRKTSQEGYKKA